VSTSAGWQHSVVWFAEGFTALMIPVPLKSIINGPGRGLEGALVTSTPSVCASIITEGI
jgi:hypothetical protein